MNARNARKSRRGALLPLLGLTLFFLLALVALAIDIGMLAVARTQCQNAADSAAMAGARTINGNEKNNYNLAQVPINAIAAAKANYILAKAINKDVTSIVELNPYSHKSGQVLIQIGSYAYTYNDSDTSKEGFNVEIPRKDITDPYSTVHATVTATGDYAFARVLGLTKFNITASSTAAHRPRDVIIIMDLSGSMRFQSLPGIYVSGGTASPSASNRPRNVSMNPESIFPKFGHHSDTAAAGLKGNKAYSTGSEMVDLANITTSSDSGPPIAEDFFQNASGTPPGPGNRAFTRSPDSHETTPGGDDFLRKGNNGNGNAYARTLNEITVGDKAKEKSFEKSGYKSYAADFKGYTEGPGYWGKTFFVWPPDPRGSLLDANDPKNHADNGAKDWRQRFFFKYNTVTKKLGWLDHNNLLFDPLGKPATAANPTPNETVMRTPNQTAVLIKEDGGVNISYQYKINYAAIFHWLKQNPVHFPNQLRAGRIKYYDAIPDPTDTGLNNRFWTTHPLTNQNERFWKDYVDFVLGLQAIGPDNYTKRNTDPDGNSLSSVPISSLIGNGDYYTWGTFQVKSKPDLVKQKGNINNAAGYAAGATALTVKGLLLTPTAGQFVKFETDANFYKIKSAAGTTSITLSSGLLFPVAQNATLRIYDTDAPPFMDYADNPHRPRQQFWFGPMTFIDYLGNYNTQRFWWPGNVHEAQSWACKVGIQTAIDDIKTNHPNDFIGMSFFSSPKYSNAGGGQHNRAVVPLGRNYQLLKDSLWFPPTTVVGTAKEITPYDADFDNVPRANGGTAPGMGFMIAYNLLSSDTSNLRFYSQPQPLYRGNAGGLGRKGATRLIIFETDGAPNTRADASLSGSGPSAYYRIRVANPEKMADSTNVEWPVGGSYSNSEVYEVVEQICKLESQSGFSTTRKKAQVFALGYGSLFEPSNSSGAQSAALNFLQTVQYKGNTATSSSGVDFPDWQRIYGDNDQRIARMKNAFTTIMQSGVQVSLLE